MIDLLNSIAQAFTTSFRIDKNDQFYIVYMLHIIIIFKLSGHICK